MSNLLHVENLTVSYKTKTQTVTALLDVSLSLKAGEVFGVVGESGCGKSTFSSVLGKLLGPAGQVERGVVELAGQDVLSFSGKALQHYRAADIAYVFQDPMSVLDPTKTIGRQFRRLFGTSDWREKSIDALAHVGLDDHRRVLASYPHQLSGGMAQRAVIAMALMRKPRLLIADEPTAALDASVRRNVMDLLMARCSEIGAAMIIISHDIPVIARYCDRIGVMYAGRFVEIGPAKSFVKAPQHPYAIALLNSEPGHEGEDGTLESLEGAPPLSISRESACAFADRCGYCVEICMSKIPPLVEQQNRQVACFQAGSLQQEAKT